MSLSVVSHKGVVERDIDIKPMINENFNPIQLIHLSKTDYENEIICSYVTNKYDLFFVIINIENETISKIIKYGNTYPPYNVKQGLYNIKNENFILSLDYSSYFKENVTVDSSLNTFLVIDKKGNEIGKYGYPNAIFQRYKISKVSSSKMYIDDKGNLYRIQSPSKVLNIYDTEYNLVKQMEMSFDDTYRMPNCDLESTGDIFKNWISWNGKVNYCRELHVNHDDKEIFVIYSIVDYPDGIVDPHSDLATRHLFLHKSDFSGNNKFGKDIEIPSQSTCLIFDNNNITLLEKIDNSFDIVEYEILVGKKDQSLNSSK